MDRADLAYAGIARQAELLRSGELSSSELVEVCLERIERINPAINAFTDVLASRARESAAAADERIARGEQAPLLGVPVAFKDEADIEGMVAQHGTAGAYEGPAKPDTEHWRRLRSAGAILLGKTTLPELAIFGFTETEAWGETRNPWDPDRTTGGSSGGSAAAVAAGLVGAASASDGAGSIRIPAANCGLFGLKPQRGRVSLAPLRRHWLGLTAAGCVSRRVIDTALWLDVAAGSLPDDADQPPPASATFVDAARQEPENLRVSWSVKAPTILAPAAVDPEIGAAVERLAEVIAGLGHRVEQRDPAWGPVGIDAANLYLRGIEEDYDALPHPERLEPRTRGFKRLARLVPRRTLQLSQDRLGGHAARINGIFEHCDVLLTPVTAQPPVPIGRWAGQGALRTLVGMSLVYPFTVVWNYLGQPAAAVPIGVTRDGLPLAAQLIAPPNREDLLISLASQLEGALRWPEHRPPLAA
jgi:amidase